MRAIVIYAADGGHTRSIAMRIAKELSRDRLPTDTYNVTQQPADEIAIEAYDAVVLGSSFHSGQPDPRIAWLIAAHRERLSLMPSAFFSVSLDEANQHREAEWVVGEFLRAVEYDPAMRVAFAETTRDGGGGWLKKQMRHWIAPEMASEPAVAHDPELDDWHAVEEFARRFSQFAHSCALTKSKQPMFLSAWEPLHYYPTRHRGPMER